MGGRIVIPVKLKLETFHRILVDGHLSLQKCRERVKNDNGFHNPDKGTIQGLVTCIYFQVLFANGNIGTSSTL